ncbi:hypothetical protein ACF0H5_006378 [Mactra antiquata]
MTDRTVRTPANVTYPDRSHGSALRTFAMGTPFRTPDRRRFGPLGSSWRTPGRSEVLKRIDNQRIRTSTPRSRYTSKTAEEVLTEHTEVEQHNIKELVGKVWHVFNLTPLYNFKENKSDLQHYSRTLSSHIAAECKRGVFVDTSEPGDATVALFSGLDVAADDHKAVLIEIRGKARNKNEDKVISQAVLFSTDLEYNPLKAEIKEEFTYFACMLIRGPESVSQTLQNWIEVQFDCKVVKQTFTSHELAFMAAMFTGFSEVHKPLELVYKVPKEIEGLSHIDYSTNASDCVRLWNKIRGTDSEIFTTEEANKFITGLESHFFEIYSIKLNAMQLLTIGTSIAFVGQDGRLKVHAKSPENVLKVCRHLTDVSVDRLTVC